MSDICLTLVGKPGCHLCDNARAVVGEVLAALPADASGVPGAERVQVEERDILAEPELYGKYWEEIPVVLIDGRQHAYWRVDPQRLTDALVAKL